MSLKICTIWLLLTGILLASCRRNRPHDGRTDTLTSGVIAISADESFAPIVAQEIEVFENLYPKAGLVPIYTDEAQALELLTTDSVRLAITTHKLSPAQHAALEQRKLFAHQIKIGTDAVALLVNKRNRDSLLTMTDLRRIATGEVRHWKQISADSPLGTIKLVFDNQHSSTVRYVTDSVCRDKPLYPGAYAQGDNAKVIDYVASDPDAIGVIGVSWIGNRDDSTNLSFNDRVAVVGLSVEATAQRHNSYRPYQAYLAMGYYPLLRNVYVITTDPREGLASGFTAFVCNDRGQRILYRAGLVPATQMIRIVQISDKL